MIPLTDLKREAEHFAEGLEAAASEVIRSGWYLLGEKLKNFEEEFARWDTFGILGGIPMRVKSAVR